MAPASVGINTFPNKKPKLDGSATQVENTTGGTNINKTDFPLTQINRVNGKTWSFVSGINETSLGITTPPNSVVVVSASASGWLRGTGNGTVFIRVLDGATILKTSSFAVSNTNDVLIDVLFIGVPLTGSRTYNMQCWNTNGDGLMYVTLRVSHVQLTDTHTTKNTNIISG